MGKTLHLHVGPHHAGDELVHYQLSMLRRSTHSNEATALPTERFSEIGHLLNDGKEDQAVQSLRFLREQLSRDVSTEFIATCPDIAGPLPAAIRRTRPYARLFENLDIFARSIDPIQCKFYFFVRPVEPWSFDVYLRHAKACRNFLSYEHFCRANRIEEMWEVTLRKCRKKLANDFIELPLSDGMENETVRDFISHAVPDVVLAEDAQGYAERRLLPTQQIIRLELLNGAAGSDLAVKRAKADVLGVELTGERNPAEGLEGLAERTAKRVQTQRVAWVLPDIKFPLGEKWNLLIPEEDAEFPDTTRATMEGQARILRFRMRGLPEPCFLLGMLISYLRRDTAHTAKALDLFLDFWTHEHDLLLAFLPTRWLISTLQTFLDHGTSPEQRLVGASGYFFANLLKAYEAERALEGLEVDATYDSPFPKTKRSVSVGLDRFDLGRTDLMVNTLALLFETSLVDDLSGRVLRELILRLKAGHTLFSRMDRSRIKFGINAKGFVDCWSFYEEPKSGEDQRQLEE